MGKADQEILPGVGPAASVRSLKDDVAYDVKRIVLRQSLLYVINIGSRVVFYAICLFLMWRGVKSFFPDAAPAVPVQTSVQSVADASGAAVASGVNAPLVLGLALVVLLLPVVTISFIRTMVAKRSNEVNAFTLGVYTAIDLILAFFMVGASLQTTGAIVLFVSAGIFSLIYNLTVMNYALRLEDGR